MTGNVLMVEPNPGILIVARNVLARAGYGVLAVSNARQGVKLVAQRPVEVLLLDAKQASPEVMRDLRNSRHPRLQVILTVQKGRDVMTLEALEASRGPSVPVEAVLEKPFTPERLLHAVQRALENAEAPLPADDTLVNVDATPFDEVTHDSVKTDIFPFAHLLQGDLGTDGEIADPADLFDDDTRVAISLDGRSAQRAARLRAALEREGLDPGHVPACMRACEAALDVEAGSAPPAPVAGSVPESANDEERSLVVAGYVGHLAIDQILQIPSSVDGPARCRLENEGAAIDVFYDGPHVVFARQDNLPAGFTLGRLLVAYGLVRDRDVDTALDPRRGLSGWLGQRLVRLGLVTDEGVREALRRQTEELVYEVVRWRKGRFSVFAREGLPPEAQRASVSIPVQHLLLEGMRRLDEWRRIEGEVGDLAAVLRPLEAAHAQDVVRSLSPEDRLVLQHIDGERTVAELVRSVARPSFDVFRALHSLTQSKLVAVG